MPPMNTEAGVYLSIFELPVRVEGFTERASTSFVTDVQPVLSRSGCNAGTCHGNVGGKNGFKLSLRGYDHAFDFFRRAGRFVRLHPVDGHRHDFVGE